MPMGNYVIGVSNYVIAIRSTLGNSVSVHTWTAAAQVTAESSSPMHGIQTMVPNEPWCA